MLKPMKKFRIVERDLTTLIGLNDYETLSLIEVLRDNIALAVPTPLPLRTVLTNYPQVFCDSIESLTANYTCTQVMSLHTKQLLERSLFPY